MYGRSYRQAGTLITSIKTTDETARSEIEELQVKLAQQNLLIQTMLAVLLEKAVVTEPEFRSLLEEIDSLDGKRDGALAQDKTPIACPACGKNNGPSKTKCLWCGRELERPDVIARPTAT